ncbi:glycoside hydrolase family 88 protein [Clostridium oryzae]|uniref:Unsaturated rhamnogalacturonyl hydrolase YesR n=1 Tax=Clostridium oryzae TaxID=1450648 RepID=A0A1V4IZK0_9CLOT|nr:glycoside hydrolase family 88 protein [Clostridium oryzae]OPJ65260.1 unsaturated rhamnogalacturonyl hydrolase YesR [Clostridium oryzae]
MKLNYDKEEILRVIDNIVKKTMTMDLTWDWPCGVAYYGVTRAYKATGNKQYLDMLKKWTEEYIELGLPDWTINTCAMGHMLITLYEETSEQNYWDIIMSKVDYIRNRAARFGDKVLEHLDFPEQAWADTLFMAAFFLLRVGVKLKDEEMINDALNQYYCHIKYLQNSSTSLWYHGYDNVKGSIKVSSNR